jgi:DNA-binding response OmpR family regulator
MLPIPAYVRRGGKPQPRRESDNREHAARHRAHGRACLGTVERTDEGPAPSPELESELMAKRILVVDDEPDIRRLVAEALDVTGYDVQTAANGEEAIRAASLYIPDLVLLDIMMPDMDGFTVYERLRARPVDLKSPIIFLTARREINDKLLGFEKGAVDYITKPFHIKELLARVKVHLGELGPPKGDIPNPLTDRELEVLGLLASGKTYKQVARALDLSQSTVRNHLHNVYHKLNVVDRAQAVIVSRENGWI